MVSRFGRSHSPLRPGGANREKLLFILAAAFAFSIMLTIAIAFKLKKSADNDNNSATVVSVQDNVGTVKLLAPERRIKAGTKLSDVRLLDMYWPISQVPSGAIRDVNELKTLYAKNDLPAGIPLQKKHLTTQPHRIGLSVSPGNRAVAINIDAQTAIEYHVEPGTHVDVVLTYHDAQRELTSKVIVQNARVLSLGGDTARNSDQSKMFQNNRSRQRSKTVTLDVAPEDALKITTSMQLGKLSLMMRSMDDEEALIKTELPKAAIDGDDREPTQNQPRCRDKGRIRIAGKGDFIIGCDGQFIPVEKK